MASVLSGLWFDPSLDGEGYNVITGPIGGVVFYYGSVASDNQRLWLVSDLIGGPITVGQAVVVQMFEAQGGTYQVPLESAQSLSDWGSLQLNFASCDSGFFSLQGNDGNKQSNTVKLAGVQGLTCN